MYSIPAPYGIDLRRRLYSTAERFHVIEPDMLDIPSKPPLPTIDPLTMILQGLRLDGIEYDRSFLRSPWAFSFPSQPEAYFHFVGDGACWLQCFAGEWIELTAGDAVLLPRGGAHFLASDPGRTQDSVPLWKSSPTWASEIFRPAVDVEGTLLFFGTMRFNLDSLHPLLRIMPMVMRAKELMRSDHATLHLLDAMASEIASNRIGACGIVSRLADVLTAQIIRSWVEDGSTDTTGWISAARHPGIGPVLAAIHAEPERDWSVASLAKLMGASRSSFASKFAEIVGETPARYLVQTRMHQARQWIIQDEERISVIAQRLGYDSEASFSRTFKRVIGMPPSHVRTSKPAGH